MSAPARDSKAVRKYLRGHAEPEVAALAHVDGGPWRSAIVIPARDEAVALAAGPSIAGALRILVINATAECDARVHRSNTALIAAAEEVPDLVVIDRTSEGRRFPSEMGVGLARKIGLDLALQAWARGRVESPWLHTTDGDARLPPEYGTALDGEATSVCAHYPYWHDPGTEGDAELDRAIALYEIWLRWHVAGMRHAGSPYAFPTIGSCLAVRADAYAQVRGVPRERSAGEDFHLLAKLAKLAPGPELVQRPRSHRVHLRARLSERVPFGTGRGVRARLERIREGAPVELPAWSSFTALGEVLGWLGRCDVDTLPEPPPRWRPLLDETGALPRIHAAHRGPSGGRARRIRDAFDALQSVRFLHAVQRTPEHAARAWTDALRYAAVDLPALAEALDRSSSDASLTELRRALESASGCRPQPGELTLPA